MKGWRINLIFIIFILCGAAIMGRLFFLQVIKGDYYKAMAQGQQGDFQTLKGERGKVFFRGGQVLATNVKKDYLFVSPQEVKDKEETAKTLSQILNLEESSLLEKIKKNSLFEKIKSDLTKEEKEKILEKKLSGVYPKEETVRDYFQNDIASHLIGFLGGDGKGQYGIEGYYDDILQGEEGVSEAGTGSELSKGADIFLTVDYNIQFMAEKLLKRAKDNFNIKSGQIIVADPNSGKILALADFPNFDPNRYNEYANEEKSEIFQNSITQKLFEPGSVFKPITMAAALDQNKITPQTSYIDTGQVKIGEDIIYNYDQRTFGKQTMTNVLEKSINSGAVFVEKQLGHKLFLDYINRFELFEPSGIDLDETFSENKEFKKGYEVNFATASFGQGIEMTPIQLVKAFSAIANGGKLVRPYLVEKISKDGQITEIKPEISSERIISRKTASQLTAMMVSVVKNGPYTRRAKIAGYYIAGKTGTSQVPEKGIYSANKSWQSFIGFAPAFAPKLLILVKLDNPETTSSEYSATPIFGEMAKYIIDYYQIPPDYEE